MSLALIKVSNKLRNSSYNFFFNCGKREFGLLFPMSVLAPRLNIGFVLAIFILEGHTPVLSELYTLYGRILDVVYELQCSILPMSL